MLLRGQTASTSFNTCDNKTDVEAMFKCISTHSTSIQQVSRGWQTVSTLLFNKIEWILKPFARILSNNDDDDGNDNAAKQ